jgi:hypothetical protein
VSFNEFCKRSGKEVDMIISDLASKPTKTDSDRKKYLTSSSVTGRSVLVILLSNISAKQHIKAYFHAWLLSENLRDCRGKKNKNYLNIEERLEVEKVTEMVLEQSWNNFLTKTIDSGWCTNISDIQSKGFEVKLE